ncbi:MAG: heme-binding domain-containing protein [Flavobacteriales bacterium]
MKKKIVWGIVAVFVLIQLYRPEKNQSTVIPDTDIIKTINPPTEIANMLKVACYDCHSNHTEGYLWYAEIAPVSWWLAFHVNEGKKHLNFSEWTTYNQKKQNHKLEECSETIESGEMPLKPYVWTHPKADLSEKEKELLMDWFKAQKK